nr:MAG TPA: hypothetical protein [Caudoviricetes sp.]
MGANVPRACYLYTSLKISKEPIVRLLFLCYNNNGEVCLKFYEDFIILSRYSLTIILFVYQKITY